MKLELKKIKYLQRASFETNNFVADLYIDGVNRATAHNEGTGGATRIIPNSVKDVEFVKLAESYCKTLPDYQYMGFSVKSTLDLVVDNIFESYLVNKALEKDMKKGILFGDIENMRIISWKGFTIEKMLSRPEGLKLIKEKISELKQRGETILNTNLPESVLS